VPALSGELRRSPRRSLSILDMGEQSPLAWEPLEQVDSAVLKDEARGQRDSPCDLRYQDLARPCRGHDARRFMNGDATNISADQLHLTHVDANTHLQVLPARGSADRRSAAQGLCGTVERREQPVASGRDLAAAEALQFRPRAPSKCLERSSRQATSPSRLAMTVELTRSVNSSVTRIRPCEPARKPAKARSPDHSITTHGSSPMV
jgi:hypothetical protein